MVWTGRARPRGVVDIVAVDADQPGAALGEQPRRGFGEEGVALRIGVGAPVPVPAGVDQHRLAGDVEAFERVRRRPPAPRRGRRGRAATASCSSVEPGEIGAVGVAVEGRVEIGAGIGDHVDPADLEARAVVIIGGRASRVQ